MLPSSATGVPCSAFERVGGPLGRYYAAGHISGKIANIVLPDERGVSDLDFFIQNGAYVRRRFVLTAEVQQAEEVLNTAFWIDNPKFYDVGHHNGALSLVWPALSRFPPVGKRLLSEAGAKKSHLGPLAVSEVLGTF